MDRLRKQEVGYIEGRICEKYEFWGGMVSSLDSDDTKGFYCHEVNYPLRRTIASAS